MRTRRGPSDLRAGLAFLTPNFLGFLAFTAWPVGASLLLSFASWDLLTPPRWVGGANFVELLGFHRSPDGWMANDPKFWKYLGNTVFLLLALPINVMGSLLLATMLSQKLRFSYGYRLVFYLPHLVAGVAIFYLWRWIYNPHYGLMNAMLATVGIDGPNWLGGYHWAKPALMLMGIWTAVGGTNMVLYLAALTQVPADLYEAAEIDGAGTWSRFVHITWPSVKPVTFFIVTMGLIGGFQGGLEAAYIMTGGGPFGATTTLGFYIYERAYVAFQMGYASAVAWVLFFIVLMITLLHWRRSGREFST
jgi:multiple sugar transport system permease protein